MAKAKKKPQLTISLLVSNRLDTIRRCLDSLRPILNAIPSELILVDTSNNPKVHRILLEYTNQVYKFKWCNDFAKARNEGLKRAGGEWFLYLDDDEWFVDTEDLIHFFRSGEYHQYGYANYQVRNFYDTAYTLYNDSWVSRMIRLDNDTEFKSKIHEYFSPVRGKRKDLSAMVYHSGYIYETEEQKRAHFQRNYELLLEMLKEDPHNLRWQTQLVQEYRSMKEWENMEAYCKECIEYKRTIEGTYDRNLFGTFYAGYIEGLTNQKKYEESLVICEQALKDTRSTELLKALVHMRMANNYLALERWEDAEKQIHIYLKEYETLSKNEALLREQKQALLVKSAFDDIYIKRAYSILISCDIKKGSTKALSKYYPLFTEGRSVIYAFYDMEQYLVEAIGKMEYIPLFSKVIADAYANPELCDFMCEMAQQWEEKEETAFQKIMYAYAQVESDFWYIWYAKIRNADVQGDKALLENAMKGFFERVQNVFMIPEKVCQIAVEHELELGLQWKAVPADKWKANVKSYLAQSKKKHLESTKMHMKKVFQEDEWRYVYFELAVFERNVALGPKEVWDLSIYYNHLKTYVEAVEAFYGRYYKKEVFLLYPNLLPESVQAAVKIREYLTLESQDKVKALSKLKECVDLYAGFAEGIRKFLELYSELEKQRETAKKREMQELRDKLVEQVKSMLASGKAEQALGIVTQLKQMLPEDLELIALGLETRLALLEGKS